MATTAATDFVRDEDDIFAELEKEEDAALASFREKRLAELSKEADELREMKSRNHGIYDIITSEKEVLKITTSTKFCVVHFYHKEFRRCEIMDKHLMPIARKHFKTRFVKIDVDNTPFLVEKMKIQILPCVVCFVDGVSTDRLIGFQDLGNNDNFSTDMLEKRLATAGVIKSSEQLNVKPKRKTIFGFAETGEEEYDSDE